MHELSLAQSIVDIVRDHVPPGRGVLVREVRVAIGDEAGVLVESLEFCFDAVAAASPYGGARLVVDRTRGRDLRVVAIDIDEPEAMTA